MWKDQRDKSHDGRTCHQKALMPHQAGASLRFHRPNSLMGFMKDVMEKNHLLSIQRTQKWHIMETWRFSRKICHMPSWNCKHGLPTWKQPPRSLLHWCLLLFAEHVQALCRRKTKSKCGKWSKTATTHSAAWERKDSKLSMATEICSAAEPNKSVSWWSWSPKKNGMLVFPSAEHKPPHTAALMHSMFRSDGIHDWICLWWVNGCQWVFAHLWNFTEEC